MTRGRTPPEPEHGRKIRPGVNVEISVPPAAGLREWPARARPRARRSQPGGPLLRSHPASQQAGRRPGSALRKTPRLVIEDMRKRPDFQEGLARLADLHRDRHPGGNAGNHVSRRADGYLKEMAAAHSPAAVNLAAYVTRLLYRRGYGEIRYDPDHLEELKRLAADHPVVFLPSHKSNLDQVLRRVLWENGHRNHHTAGGINMSFFPVGPIARRAGLFFIRRTFGDDPRLQVRPPLLLRISDRAGFVSRVVRWKEPGAAPASSSLPATGCWVTQPMRCRLPAAVTSTSSPPPSVTTTSTKWTTTPPSRQAASSSPRPSPG